MKRVIVFGAGASVHFGVPTMDRFIDVAEDLRGSSSNSISVQDFEVFFDVVQNRFRQLHAKSAVNLDNIESVFGLVEMAKLLGRLPGFSAEQIEQLSVAIRTVLVETVIFSGTFDYTPDNRWQPPEAYLSIAEHLDQRRLGKTSDDVSLITFNYDLGLDFALHWSNFDIDYGLSNPRPNSVPLYKLHGSLNWVTCKVCGGVRAIPMQQVFQAHAGHRASRQVQKLPLDPRRGHQGLGPHCPGDEKPYQITLVPPSWNKTQYSHQLAKAWSAAAKAIAEAQDIVIAGYSLPDSDSFFRDLLALGLEGPTRVRSFTVVNPDDKVGPRFERLLGPETRSRFSTIPKKFEVWVEDTFGTSPRIHAV